ANGFLRSVLSGQGLGGGRANHLGPAHDPGTLYFAAQQFPRLLRDRQGGSRSRHDIAPDAELCAHDRDAGRHASDDDRDYGALRDRALSARVRTGCNPAISFNSLLVIASPKDSKSLTTIRNEPGPPVTLSRYQLGRPPGGWV